MSAAGEPFVGSVRPVTLLCLAVCTKGMHLVAVCVQRGETRLRHTEFVFPVVVGTCAFYLGKKVNVPPLS